MSKTVFDCDVALRARIDAVVEREGVSLTRALNLLVEAGLEQLLQDEALLERLREPKPEPTIEQRLDSTERLRWMLLGLADAGGSAPVGELGVFGQVKRTSSHKWSRVLLAHGLIDLHQNQATLTDAGRDQVRRLRRQHEGRAA